MLVLGLWLSHFRFSLWYLNPWPALVSDFLQYCDTVIAVVESREPRFLQRSPIAAWPAAFCSHWLGIIDGLIVSNGLAQLALLASLVGWSYCVMGRMAAVLTVPFALSFAPITLMSRMLDFSPIMAATWSFSAFLCVLSIRHKNPFWAGLGAGLALFVDVRGLNWGLCAFFLGVAVSIYRPKVINIVSFCGVIVLSYLSASHLLSSSTPSLELQTWWFAQERAGILNPEHMSWAHETFVWGKSNPLHIPSTLFALFEMPEGGIEKHHLDGLVLERWRFIYPKLFLLGLAVIIGVWAGIKKKLRAEQMWMLLLPAIPFIVALFATGSTQIAMRRLLIAWPFAPVWLACSLAVLLPKLEELEWVPGGGMMLGMWAILWSRMDEQWAQPIQEPPDVGALYSVHPTQGSVTPDAYRDSVCEAALVADLEKGHPWGGRFKMKWPFGPQP